MKRHSVFTALIVVLCAASLSVTVLADEPLTVRVGAYENPPKIFTDENGAVSGFWPDLVEYIASQEGWQIEWVHGTWTQCLERLQEDEIDVMPDVAYSEERSKKYRFSSEVVLPSWSQVYTQESTGIESILDLGGKKVAVLKGSVNVEGPEGIKELVRRFDISCTFIEGDSYLEVFRLVKSGRADAGVSNKDFGAIHSVAFGLRGTAIIFQPLDIQFAFPVESDLTRHLMETIDRQIKALKQDPLSVYYRALEQHLGVKSEVQTVRVLPGWAKNMLWIFGVAIVLFLVALLVSRREVRRRTSAFRESEERFRDLYENAPNAYFSVDVDGRIRMLNRRVEDLLEYTTEELMGRPVLDLYANTPSDKEKARKILQRFVSGEAVRGEELQMQRADGQPIWIGLTANPVRDRQGQVVGSRLMVVDITERKRAEKEKQALESKLRQSQKLESIGTLASGVAHEINNPLTGMINYADLIADRVEDDRLKGFAQGIIKEGNRVAEIVKGLLYFARQEKQSHSPARIEDIIDASLLLIGSVLKKDQITLYKDIPDDLPQVRCRSQQIEQVIINLLTNARDALNKRYEAYHEDKLIRIRVQPFEEDGIQWIRTTVEDHGTGIPEEAIDRIFDPFFTTKPRDAGTGLGLSVSYGIIKDHHGELRVESKPGEYTRFYLDLRVNNGWTLE